jgi:hypothetical protein
LTFKIFFLASRDNVVSRLHRPLTQPAHHERQDADNSHFENSSKVCCVKYLEVVVTHDDTPITIFCRLKHCIEFQIKNTLQQPMIVTQEQTTANTTIKQQKIHK